MINISDELKELYRSGNGRKKLNISISESETLITNSNVVSESMIIKESLTEGESLKIGSCNSTSFEITIADITEDLIGKEINPKLIVDTDTTDLSLGFFTVESAKKEIGRPFRKITAYDRMKKLSVDVSEWYKKINFPVTIKNFRNGLCEVVGIEQEDITLPFDSMTINKTLDEDGVINGLELMQGICELNGCFGKISRDGKFEYLYLSTGDPVETLNGILKSYPQCEDYKVEQIDGVIIKFTDSDISYQSSTNTNPYIITDNYLIYDKTEEIELESIANTIAGKINGISYKPTSIECVGQPYLEIGDKVSFNDEYGKLNATYILKRDINGIQALADSIEASGDEYITQDVNSVTSQLAKLNSDNGRLKIKLSQVEDGLSLKVSKGDVSSQLSLETEQITLQGNRVVIDSDKWKVDADGKQTCSDLTIIGGDIKANNIIIDGGIKVTVPWGTTGSSGDAWDYVKVLEVKGNTAQGAKLVLEYGDTEVLIYDPNGMIIGASGSGIITTQKDVMFDKKSTVYFAGTILNADGMNMGTYSTVNITNKTNVGTGSVNVYKRYNSATITCNVSKISQELDTSAGYALIGTLPDDCKPLYRIIEYHRLNGNYVGQIVVETTGEVKVGYTKKNDGTAANLPATSMYWAFTYTI